MLDKVLTQSVDAFDFRPARVGDIEDMVELYREFFDESDLSKRGLEYDPKRAWAFGFDGITRGTHPWILAFEKASGRLIGGVSYRLSHNYTTQPGADLGEFFVRKQWRGTPVARVLLTLVLEIAKADGAVMFNAGISSGIDPGPLSNLLRKLGFEDTNSTLLVRRL